MECCRSYKSINSKRFHLKLDIVGLPKNKALKKLNKTINQFSKYKDSIKYYGSVEHSKIQKIVYEF
jgi:hypothetical protein